MDERRVRREDMVIGISASGQAAFVTEALRRAHEIGAQTILLTSNASQTLVEAAVSPAKSPAAETAASANDIDLIIDLKTGPEIVTGSTRLKAGTVTKVALNIISTGAMVRLGRVRGNLMIDLQATNKKLRERAIGLVAQLAGCDRDAARSRLARADWNLRAALQEGAGKDD
jgi:N-acetylmuramic acid 6-phosphate (MurNAc-6-P) etherase